MERGYWIRSKPVYSALNWQQKASAHLVIVEGSAGGMAAIKLFQQMQPMQPITVIYVKDKVSDADYSVALGKIVLDDLLVFETNDEAMTALRKFLPSAFMGLRIYVAGSEKFMWTVAEIAAEHGVDDIDINKELTGTLARSVYCVHCKAITHDAHTNIKKCVGCGRMLFVRDHFSRLMGAYMGLMVDAESPGEVPEIEEIYP
ncbi:hypothetical protein MTYP_00463 [Methylophilaceae bacterium]|nr:hypothetical protein MTYP_00463 [Methylophilaceae bacterium]